MTKLPHPASFHRTIRPARAADIPALVRLEHRNFEGDRLSPRSFRHMLDRANASLLVDEEGGEVRGYALLLFRRRNSLARLYSFAVDWAHRGKGIAKALLARSERLARERRCDRLRLEVRRDNDGAQRLYQRLGYQPIGEQAGYYEDGMTALRYEKSLAERRPDEGMERQIGRDIEPHRVVVRLTGDRSLYAGESGLQRAGTARRRQSMAPLGRAKQTAARVIRKEKIDG